MAQPAITKIIKEIMLTEEQQQQQQHPPRRRESKRQRKETKREEEEPCCYESMSDGESDLREVEKYSRYVHFDSETGRPTPACFDERIKGIVKKKLPTETVHKLTKIHDYIKNNVDSDDMVPWSGINDGDRKLRAFAFMGNKSRQRLIDGGVRLYAAEKEGDDAVEDEKANNKAVCILNIGDDDDNGHKNETNNKDSDEDNKESEKKNNTADEDQPLDFVSITKEVVEAINPDAAGLDPKFVCYEELIAYQINLHNGVRYLPAHLDFPLHEGFGKAICTVAIKGKATVMLIGNETETIGGNDVGQPAWRFTLEQGECYIMSDMARNKCLHAVVTDNANNTRESLNLRFGLHTKEEADEITKFWLDDEEK